MMKKPSSEAIVFVDFEFTGLDPLNCQILEAACVITDKELEEIVSSGSLVINQPEKVLSNMSEWCMKQHKESGLIEKCRESTLTLARTEEYLCRLIDVFVELRPDRLATLAGNSVYMDKKFIDHHMPLLSKRIGHRLIDVSSISELCNRWYPSIWLNQPSKSRSHRAIDDVKDSIAQLKFYREQIFIKSI